MGNFINRLKITAPGSSVGVVDMDMSYEANDSGSRHTIFWPFPSLTINVEKVYFIKF